MDFYEQFLHVTKQEASRTASEREPTLTHYIQDSGHRARVYLAVCGAPVHSSQMARLSSGDPTCPVCKNLLAEWDTDASTF